MSGRGREALLVVTPTGWGVAGATVVLAIVAGVLRFAELAVLAAGGAAAIIVVARRPQLAAQIEVVPGRVRRGETAAVTVTAVDGFEQAIMIRVGGTGDEVESTPQHTVTGSGRL
ncbi:hypothetical protein [Frankia sp. Cr1]|uniref:hypothetical protein n=1 Tax=Frankia sp. Cr1 TaxID=3073931 RepID=UPI002AD39F4F|nr:hypothetical protein [Frankia sp. Cr1]